LKQAVSVPLLLCAIVAPPLFLFAMIQYSAILYPYWDHLTDMVQISQYYDGTLTLKSLLEPQQPTRPFFPRLIFVINAVLTKWDIRSEFVYIYLTVYGGFAALLFALWRSSRDWPLHAVLTAALLISIIACSPVGSQNHYWSLMLIATLCYFGSLVALVAISVYPESWPANIVGAMFAWVAAYSLGPGLFLFPAIFLVQQLVAPQLFKPTRWSMFWLCNWIVCYSVYFPGAPFTGSTTPKLFDFLAFTAVYIGSPFGSLLWFPYMGAIDIPHTTVINAICGTIIIGLTLYTVWRALLERQAKRPETLFFLSVAAYVGASALVTTWGRASGPFAIIGANSSRYSLFSACLLFGLIIYYAGKYARRELIFTTWHKVAVCIFVAASAVSYVRSFPVYKKAHDDNVWLAEVYNPRAAPTDLDTLAYPDFDYFEPKRADMLRLGIGPYRTLAEPKDRIYSGAFVAAEALKPGHVVTQRFQPTLPAVKSISFKLVTWGITPDAYRIVWKVVETKDQKLLGEGTLATAGIKDWEEVSLRLTGASDGSEIEVSLSADGIDRVEKPVGLALYPPKAKLSSTAEVDRQARADGASVGLTAHYAR
jgi:hypothetical protein